VPRAPSSVAAISPCIAQHNMHAATAAAAAACCAWRLSVLTQVDPVDFPAAVQAGAGLPGGGAGELVPGAGHGTGE
jgi:hypothetical protein